MSLLPSTSSALPGVAAGSPGGARVDRGDGWTDEALLGAYADGRRSALRELIDRYHDELLNFLTKFLGSRAAAEDVFQETFLQIHLSAGTFDRERRFKPWLFTIAANKARDYHRKHSRRHVYSLDVEVGDSGDGQRFVDLMSADMPAPDVPIDDEEQRRRIRSVVDELPPHLREILLLAYFQRLAYQQIADSLQIPLGTVKSRLHAAVAHFAAAWERVTDEDPETSR